MPQSHTGTTIDHSAGDQNTGNHKVPGAPDERGADRFGGSRAGAQNVEDRPDQADSVQVGPDVERLKPLDEGAGEDVTGSSHAERSAERDERGRL